MGGNRLMKKQSPAIHLVSHVWNTRPEFGDTSWRRINGSMMQAVNLAITAGLRFDADDFKTIYETMRGGYWFRDFYSLSIVSGNSSAYQSYEKWAGYKPFIWPCRSSPYIGGDYRSWHGSRLHPGAHFKWGGEEVVCTTITGESIVACSYKTDREIKGLKVRAKFLGEDGPGNTRQIRHRYTITHADLRAARKASRSGRKAEAA